MTDEDYNKIEWLPKTKDGQSIYPKKTIWVVGKDVDYHHRSGRSVEWYRPFKHEAKHFWVGDGKDTEIGISNYEEYLSSDCFGEEKNAQVEADRLNDFEFGE